MPSWIKIGILSNRVVLGNPEKTADELADYLQALRDKKG